MTKNNKNILTFCDEFKVYVKEHKYGFLELLMDLRMLESLEFWTLESSVSLDLVEPCVGEHASV